MSRQANPKLIGGFVFGAIALAVAAVVIFGTLNLFTQTKKFVVFFDGSVKGLSVGASVDFRGTEVGKVDSMTLLFDPETNDFKIETIIEIRPDRIALARGAMPTQPIIGQLIERGLRAQLQTGSLVTGQQYIELDFHPDSPARFVGGPLPYPEVPAIPSQIQELQASLTAAAGHAPDLLQGATVLVNEAATMLSPQNQQQVTEILSNLNRFTGTLAASDEDVRRTITDLAATMDSIRKNQVVLSQAVARINDTAGSVDSLIQDNRGRIAAILQDVQGLTVSLRRASDQLNGIMTDNRRPIRGFTEDSLGDLSALIAEARDMVSQMNRTFQDFDRDPARFLLGGERVRTVQPGQGSTPR